MSFPSDEAPPPNAGGAVRAPSVRSTRTQPEAHNLSNTENSEAERRRSDLLAELEAERKEAQKSAQNLKFGSIAGFGFK
jgi:hypothetical protein